MKLRTDVVGGGYNSGWKGRLRYRPTDGSDVVEMFGDPEEVEARVSKGEFFNTIFVFKPYQPRDLVFYISHTEFE